MTKFWRKYRLWTATSLALYA